jgi:outer membrane immunogenic protein
MDEGFRQLSITTPTCVGSACTGNNSTWGWMVGAGFERALDPHWSVRLEYNFLDYGNKEHVTVTNGVSANVFDITRTFQIVKLGVNYRFGDWGKSPVVAKY